MGLDCDRNWLFYFFFEFFWNIYAYSRVLYFAISGISFLFYLFRIASIFLIFPFLSTYTLYIDFDDGLSQAKVQAFDPKAMDSAKEIFKDKIHYAKFSYDALKNADCLLVLTEWNEFRRPDFDKIKELLNAPIIIDGRNQYDKGRLEERGFEYINIGKKSDDNKCENFIEVKSF